MVKKIHVHIPTNIIVDDIPYKITIYLFIDLLAYHHYLLNPEIKKGVIVTV
jgi:hypothetical protein